MLRVRYQTFDYNSRTGLLITDEKDGRRYAAKPLVFEERTNTYTKEPTILIEHPLDELVGEVFGPFFRDWIEAGKILKVNFGEDFVKEREALLYHLEDMRKLVFKGK